MNTETIKEPKLDADAKRPVERVVNPRPERKGLSSKPLLTDEEREKLALLLVPCLQVGSYYYEG